MFRTLIAIFLITIICGCNDSNISPSNVSELTPASDGPAKYELDVQNVPETSSDEIAEYQGKTIDQIFPILSENDFSRGSGDRGNHTIAVSDYDIAVSGFAPVSISKGGRKLLDLRTRAAKEEYWSILLGRSKLLGPESDQLFVVSSGPGGVCCTNYWIADIKSGSPRLIFRSEDFGSFRDAMEIFDADGDGIYELVQFDSCMRYIFDDCGSCTPEPRAYFKYDTRRGQYRPAQNILQDFVRDSIEETELSLDRKYKEVKESEGAGDTYSSIELRRFTVSHVADLLHWGFEKRAWEIFDKYGGTPGDKKEMLGRLKKCNFYQELKKE